MLFFDSVQEMKELFDQSLFDQETIRMMEVHEASGLMTDKMHPFPDVFRAEVYSYYIDEIRRLSPDTRVSLCAETKEMWNLLGPRLSMTPNSFVCNCGPICIPRMEARQVRGTPEGIAVAVE
jgi:hypothetical protein